MKRTIFVVLIGIVPAFAGQVVTDEEIRLEALAAVFPGMSISVLPGKKINESKYPLGGINIDVPDALRNGPVYIVAGPPSSKIEECAATDVANFKATPKSEREVRFEILKPDDAQYVAVVQYKFPNANAALVCLSIGRVLLLTRNLESFRVSDDFLLETRHHDSIPTIRLARVMGGRTEQLIVESDWGGAASAGSSLLIFDFSKHLDLLLQVDSSLSSDAEKAQRFTQTLDISRSMAQGGAKFCFTKTTYAEDDKWFRPPRVTHPCYPRGTIEPR